MNCIGYSSSEWFWSCNTLPEDGWTYPSATASYEPRPDTTLVIIDRKRKASNGNSLTNDTKRRQSTLRVVTTSEETPVIQINKRNSLSRRRFSNFPVIMDVEVPHPQVVSSAPSKRFQRVQELLDTEKNYVAILTAMLDIVRRIPLDAEQPNCVLLDSEAVDEINTTFGQLPQLLEVHTMIVHDLENATKNWHEEISIGAIFTKYGPCLEDYVPFVNSFERIKAFLTEWEDKCIDFQNYLKVCQMRPGCGRQHLNDLLIRPIQRVPSVVNLLKDIKSRTDTTNPDSEELTKAITEMERVLTFINEQKREAEVQELLRDIDKRPKNPLATFPAYVAHLDCMELASDQFDQKGSCLTLILFTDVLEVVCKKRPTFRKKDRTTSLLEQNKTFEHLEYVPFNRIKELWDISDGKDVLRAFIVVLVSTEDEDCRYKFAASLEFAFVKSAFLRKVAGQLMASPTKLDTCEVLRRINSSETDLKPVAGTCKERKPTAPRRSASMVIRRRLTIAVSFGRKLRRAASELIFSEKNFVKGKRPIFEAFFNKAVKSS